MLRSAKKQIAVGLLWVLGLVLAASGQAGPVVGIVGAGPAGMGLAEELSDAGISVVIFEATPYVGGNVAHGYYYSKTPENYLNRFRSVAARRNVQFFGKVKIGERGDLTLADLAAVNLDAVVFTSGAAPKLLGIPGEAFATKATDIFYYYNGHPDHPYPPLVGRRVAVVGSGSAASDIQKYLLTQNRGIHFIQLVRRGPGQYANKHGGMGATRDVIVRPLYRKELERIRPQLELMGQTPQGVLQSFKLDDGSHAEFSAESSSAEILHFVSPVRIVHDGKKVTGIEVEENTPVKVGEGWEGRGTGKKFIVTVDTVISSIGGTAYTDTGLPIYDGRVRTQNLEDRLIRVDKDVPDPGKYFASRGLDHYRVDFSAEPWVPPIPVFVAGWARLPGIGSTLETERFSNIPDGARLGRLLAAQFAERPLKVDTRFSEVVTRVGHRLGTLGCGPALNERGLPEKRPHLKP